jgi:hypothetical protein
VHAAHTVHTVPDLRIAAGRCGTFSITNFTSLEPAKSRSSRPNFDESAGDLATVKFWKLKATNLSRPASPVDLTEHGRALNLRFLPLLDLRQCLFNCAVRFVFQFRISNQPLIEGFFRPEEVNDPSTTTREENSRCGLGTKQFCFVENQMDS